MQNKTNENKVVLVVSHQHNEPVIVDIFNKYMPELLTQYKVSFLSEENEQRLEEGILLDLTLSSKDYKEFYDKVSEAKKAGDINYIFPLEVLYKEVVKRTQQLGFRIDSTEHFEELKKALKNKDKVAVSKFIDTQRFQKSFSFEYLDQFQAHLRIIGQHDARMKFNKMIKHYQQDPAIKYAFIDVDLIKEMTEKSIEERDLYMSGKILDHMINNHQDLFIVSVGSLHVQGMTKILSDIIDLAKQLKSLSSELNYTVIPVLEKSLKNCIKSISPDALGIEATIETAFPRTQEEQDKDEMKFIDSLLKSLMFLSGKDEVSLCDHTTKQFKCSLGGEAIEKVKALGPLKKANSIVCNYDGQTKTFTITYPNVMQEKIDEIFPQQRQSFVKFVGQQKSEAMQEIARQ